MAAIKWKTKETDKEIENFIVGLYRTAQSFYDASRGNVHIRNEAAIYLGTADSAIMHFLKDESYKDLDAIIAQLRAKAGVVVRPL